MAKTTTTTTTKKMTKAARATNMKAENPDITNAEIAKQIGSSGSYVSRILAENAAATGGSTTTSRGTTTRVTGTSRKYAKGNTNVTNTAGVCSTETATVLSARAQMTEIVAAVGPKSAQTILDCVSQPCGG